MAIEEIITSLLFGLEENNRILVLNFQDDLHIINFKYSGVKDRTDSFLFKGIDQIHHVRSNISNLPFQYDSFNLIILKGIATNLEMPTKVQKTIFQSIFSLLRSDGILYLGIENRLSPAFFANNKVSLIKKHFKWKNANNIFTKFLHLIFIIKYYRTHLYSSRGYLNLLRKIGFTDIFLYGAPRSFNHPCILSLEKSTYNYFSRNLDSPRKAIKQFVIRFLNVLGANKYFCYSYILIGRKREV